MDFVEQLKSSVDIVKVVGEYVRLKKSGAGPRYSGLCPFHTEKTASFSVHQTHQFYKCFGCNAGGDVIKFVMEIERLSFWEALKLLADRNGIPMPKKAEQSDDETRLRAALYEMLYCPDIPPVVTINEAVEMAKEFSGMESGKFVNGILDRIRKELPRPARTPASDQGTPPTTS